MGRPIRMHRIKLYACMSTLVAAQINTLTSKLIEEWMIEWRKEGISCFMHLYVVSFSRLMGIYNSVIVVRDGACLKVGQSSGWFVLGITTGDV